MGNTVQGKNIGGYLKVSGVYYPIFCGQTLDFNFPQELVETTNKNSGSMRDYEAGMSTASMSITGVTILNNSDGRIAITYLHQQSVRKVKQEWKITLTDDDNNIIVYTFFGLIEDGGFSKTLPGYSKSSVTIRVCGNITMDTVQPPGGIAENVRSDWWVFTAGATSISGLSSVHGYSLVGKTILEVDREGAQHNIITSGTPVERQCKFNSVAGSVSFDANNPSNGETVFVLFK